MTQTKQKSARVERTDDRTRFIFPSPIPVSLSATLIVLLVLTVASLTTAFIPNIQKLASLHSALWIIGNVLASIIVVIAVFALIVARATRLVVELSSDGYQIINAGAVKHGIWADVTDVSATPDWQRIVIRHGKIARSYISSPRGDWSQQMSQLSDEIREHLKAS